MGTWRTFDVRGSKVEADRISLVHHAVSEGMNLFDSSPMYGEAERVLGKAVANIRDQVIVATKVWSDDDRVAERQIADSLRYFGGAVDLFQVHNLVSAPRRLASLAELRAEGKVRAIGITHWSEDAYDQMRRYLDQVDVIQIPYNPGQARAGEGILDDAAARDLGVLIMRPFGEGALLRRHPTAHDLDPLRAFGITTWPQALLKWGLSDPRCHVAIPATSDLGHLVENVGASTPPWFGPDERELVSRLAR